MKKKFIICSLLCGIMLPSLSACGQSEDVTLLRVLNSEDYIYLNNPKDGYDEPDLIDQFSEYIANDPVLSEKYGKVKVVYDTADTMENIYSEMQTGKTNYDLICASEYIVTKMVRYGLVKPIDKSLVPNYFGNPDEGISAKAADVLKNRINDITTTPIQGDYKGIAQNLGDYSVGYMWGTLGFLFNPGYKIYQDQGIDEATVIADMANYDTVWKKYTNTIAIKDSMRDTFALGIMHAYHDSYTDKYGNVHDGFSKLADNFYVNQSELHETYSDEEYYSDFSKIFNYVISDEANADKVIADVKKELEELKKNIFGLEVDSGKQDIITGKIGINWAWSGDAVYSQDQAEDPSLVGEENVQTLYYSVPKTGSNLWMDIWTAPKLPSGKQSEKQWELAHEFLNFLSDPYIASKNMDYTGYTSFVAGDSIIDLVRDWYDIRTDEVYCIDEDDNYFSIYAIDNSLTNPTVEDLENEELCYEIGYSDLESFRHDVLIDSRHLWYLQEKEIKNPDYNPQDEESKETIIESTLLPLEIELESGEKIQKTYGDLTLYDLEDVEQVDLSYFFQGTLDEYEDADMIFYPADTYAVYAFENEGGTREICVGRQFYTQYPDENTIVRCAVMRDYEKYNDSIMRMWEDFKSEPLPTWALILFIIIILGFVALLLGLFYNKTIKKMLRKKRLENK